MRFHIFFFFPTERIDIPSIIPAITICIALSSKKLSAILSGIRPPIKL